MGFFWLNKQKLVVSCPKSSPSKGDSVLNWVSFLLWISGRVSLSISSGRMCTQFDSLYWYCSESMQWNQVRQIDDLYLVAVIYTQDRVVGIEDDALISLYSVFSPQSHVQTGVWTLQASRWMWVYLYVPYHERFSWVLCTTVFGDALEGTYLL